MKDKYGVFAYAVSMDERSKTTTDSKYHVTIDGEEVEFEAFKLYVVNSGMMGTGFSITNSYAVDDGLLDVFLMNQESKETITAAVDRFLHLSTSAAQKYYRQCKEMTIAHRSRSADLVRRRVHRPHAGDDQGVAR